MAHFKLNELDEQFLELPQGAVLIGAGSTGAQSWLERDKDTTVRLVVATVAVATADADALATLRATIAGASLIAAIKYVVAHLTHDDELARVHPPLSPLARERAAELMRSLEAVDAFASLPRGR